MTLAAPKLILTLEQLFNYKELFFDIDKHVSCLPDMNKLVLLLLVNVAFCVGTTFAQRGNVWAFGEYAGIDFNSGSPVAIKTGINTNSSLILPYALEACASVCDTNGALLFYTEGSFVWDRNNNLMPNGSGLTGLPLVDDAYTATISTSQGAVIVPMPDSANKYYLFSLSEIDENSLAGRLYYSIIDMTLNGGMGDIESGSKGVLVDSNLVEKMTAVVGDNCDIWLLTCSRQSKFKAYEITESGVNTTPVVSSVGLGTFGRPLGCMTVSPDRKKIAAASCTAAGLGSYGASLYHFDPATGIVSDPEVELSLQYGAYGLCFSPDNSKLYVGVFDTNPGSLYQYDLTSGDSATIIASRTTVGPYYFGHLKLAPDGKIYFPSGSFGQNPAHIDSLGAINSPNLPGAACQYISGAIAVLPGTNAGTGLPNVVPDLKKTTASSRQVVAGGCFATNVSLEATDTTGSNYIWNDMVAGGHRSVQQAGTYVLTYHTAPCITHTDTFVVHFGSQLPLLGSLPGCYGMHNGKAWVQPAPDDTTTYTYTWLDAFGEILQPSITSSVIADTLYNQFPGNYVIKIEGANGCDTSFPITIDAPVNSDFIHASDTGMCPHDTITLHATGGVAYHWLADSNVYISDTLIADPMVSPSTDWNYVLYGENSSGCLDTATARVRVYPDAVIQLPDSVALYNGESYQFNPTTNCLTFNWFPPQGLSADNISTPLASPSTNTQYVVTGTTENGCITKEIANVYIDDNVLLTLPNAFVPGNGTNNILKPIYRGSITHDYLRIYNRWGQMVYESSNINEGWDGTWHGMPQGEGVFIYSMQGQTPDGRILSKHGNVTLIR